MFYYVVELMDVGGENKIFCFGLKYLVVAVDVKKKKIQMAGRQ